MKLGSVIPNVLQWNPVGVLTARNLFPRKVSAEPRKRMRREANSIPVPTSRLSASLEMQSPVDAHPASESADSSGQVSRTGLLIVNADDWGRDRDTTDRTFECFGRGSISSVSAMVFMEDSERAAAMARERGIDAGLHVNLTSPYTASNTPSWLVRRQGELAAYLRRHRFATIVYHPGLSRSFEYVMAAQLEEFSRLYGAAPTRLDGHHHMHLCANVLLGRLLPPGTIVRRNFSFQRGEKSFGNRFYRKAVDRLLARRHHLADFFFSLPPFEPASRLRRIFSLARDYVVEVETHPLRPEEHRFLTDGEIFRWAGNSPIAPRYGVRLNGNAAR
jgi:predicted glycoside hydrolase/deacetylase ChbG (UPF0249 family)